MSDGGPPGLTKSIDMKLQRFQGNPILSPHPGHSWEDLAVFNPAA
jgi:hypothetical protein